MAVDQDWVQSLQRLVETILGGPGIGGTINSGTKGTWGIFTETRPSVEAKNGELIIISSAGGSPPHQAVLGLRRYEFEIRVIGTAEDEGEAKAKVDEIYNGFAVQGPQTSVDGRVFDFFEILTHPDLDDVDESGHFEYAFTVRTQVRE